MNWIEGLKAFEQVAKTASFTVAARALNTTASVITKRVKMLEDQLKSELFVRTTRKVSLTDAGELLLQRLKHFLEEWETIHSEMLDMDLSPKGTVSLWIAPNILGSSRTNQLLCQFLKMYPKIKIEHHTTASPIALTEKQADLLIAVDRYVLDSGNVIAKPLFTFRQAMFASPDYLETAASLSSIDDLANHNCLVYQKQNCWRFNKGRVNVLGSMAGDSGVSLINAAKNGLGIIRAPDFMVEKAVATGDLIRVLPEVFLQSTIKLFFVKRTYQPKKIRVLIDYLCRPNNWN